MQGLNGQGLNGRKVLMGKVLMGARQGLNGRVEP